MDVRSIISGQLAKAQEDIRMNMSSQGVNASGRTSKSLRIEDRGSSIVLVIGGDRSMFGRTAPLETLEIGSRSGKRGAWFKGIIHDWTIEKGMVFENESHRWAVSTVIARKIEEEGTARHKNHIDVYTSVIDKTKENIRSIISSDFRIMLHTMLKSI